MHQIEIRNGTRQKRHQRSPVVYKTHKKHTHTVSSGSRNRRSRQQRRVKLRRIKATKTQVARVHTNQNSREKKLQQPRCVCVRVYSVLMQVYWHFKDAAGFFFLPLSFFFLLLSLSWCLLCFAALCLRLLHRCTVFDDDEHHHFWRISSVFQCYADYIRNCGMLLLLACLCACVMLLRFCAIFIFFSSSK